MRHDRTLPEPPPRVKDQPAHQVLHPRNSCFARRSAPFALPSPVATAPTRAVQGERGTRSCLDGVLPSATLASIAASGVTQLHSWPNDPSLHRTIHTFTPHSLAVHGAKSSKGGKRGQGFGFWCPLPSSSFLCERFRFSRLYGETPVGSWVGTETWVLAPRREERQARREEAVPGRGESLLQRVLAAGPPLVPGSSRSFPGTSGHAICAWPGSGAQPTPAREGACSVSQPAAKAADGRLAVRRLCVRHVRGPCDIPLNRLFSFLFLALRGKAGTTGSSR